MSYTTRLTPGTSLAMRVEMRPSTSYGMREPVCGHCIFAADCADSDDVSVGAEVAGNADAAGVGQDREALPDFAVEVVLAYLIHNDGVGFSEDIKLFVRYLADDANCESGAGEGLAIDDLIGQAEFQTNAAHLVLEQIAERFDEAELHVLRQAADIVV